MGARVHINRLGSSNAAQPSGRQSIQIRPPATVKKTVQVKGQRPRLADAEFAGDAITFTRQVFVVPAGGAFIRVAELMTNTTIAAHNDNHWTFVLKVRGGATIGTFTTDGNGGGAALTQNVAQALALTVAECDLAAGVVLDLVATVAAAAVDQTTSLFNLNIEYLPRSSNDFLWPVLAAPTGGMFLQSATITADTTITEDAANYWTATLQTSAGVALASRNTLTGSGGTLTLNTPAAMTVVAGERDQAAAVVLNLKLDAATESAADINNINFTIELEYVSGSTSQGFSLGSFVVPTGGARFTKVQIVWDATIAADADAYWSWAWQTVGATVIAARDTETGDGGVATADAVNTMTIVAAAAVQAAGAVLEFKATPATASSVDLSSMVGVLNVEYQAA